MSIVLDGTLGITSVTGSASLCVAGPAFRVGLSAAQTGISSGVYTKITFNSKSTAGTFYDTANCFDATTNYRFTPNVAGYYQINLSIDGGLTTSCTRLIPLIYKNGSIYSNSQNGNSTQWYNAGYSDTVYLNGSTDYIEAYVYILGTSPAVNTSSASFFAGQLARSA